MQNGLDLTATAGFTDYFWKLNGANITAANLNTYTTTRNGAYSVQVVDVNNCSAISNTVNVNSVGIDDVSSLDLTIFPNPANNVLHISSEITFEKIQITNPLGDIIKEFIRDFAPKHYRQREDKKEAWRFQCDRLNEVMGEYCLAAIDQK